MIEQKISLDAAKFASDETLYVNLSDADDQFVGACITKHKQLYGQPPADGDTLYSLFANTGAVFSACAYSSRELVAVLQILSDLYGTTAFDDGRLITLFDTIEETATPC